MKDNKYSRDDTDFKMCDVIRCLMCDTILGCSKSTLNVRVGWNNSMIIIHFLAIRLSKTIPEPQPDHHRPLDYHLKQLSAFNIENDLIKAWLNRTVLSQNIPLVHIKSIRFTNGRMMTTMSR